ncbi:hypothetical protein JZ751_020505 [Albula glossodonta]|uniref:DIS3-like exonuclease 1 n=1 Tax=Albula glossodonta TaxID=121402 RepID=A0A8T2PMV1_9TELE|nr:hypothetical protein JZ751_020505 [Albula glossodonta]
MEKITKTDKVLHLKSSRGRKVRVVREHYLREDIPCFSALCQAECANDGKLLSADLTHYVVPDAGVVRDFLEVLEFRELGGIEYLQSFWPELQAAQELHGSISQALQERESEGQERQYAEHLPPEGTLNVNKHRAQLEAFVRVEGSVNKGTGEWAHSRVDVLVFGGKPRNRAVHGDVVVVELLSQGEWRGRNMALTEGEAEERAGEEPQSQPMPTGKVVGILQRNWRDYVVTFPPWEEVQSQSHSSQRILVTPWDYRLPRIRISTHQAETLQGQRAIVRLDSWESTSLYPNGHFVRVLGKAGELETEIQTILTENSIHVAPFSEAQLREMPVNSEESPWQVEAGQVEVRRDLRNTHLVFSIDPKGCEDVDDTLSVRTLPGGAGLELGVHIADVTHFVRDGSLTDQEARSRATTYYLADRRYDMLPAVLSADLCSLLGGVDRYAMSVLWELDPQTMAVRKVWFGRTLIRSAYQLHYELAQSLLNGEPGAEPTELAQLGEAEKGRKMAELREALGLLTHIARHLRARRDEGGALELEGVEVRAQLDEDGNIAALVPRQPLEVHETVAECMIYANHWVARKIQESFPHQALLRHHPAPRQEFFSQLTDSAKALGFNIDTRSNKALADSLDQAVDPQDPLVNRLLRMMATQAMSNALYFSTGALPLDQYEHYGLALDRYTHFTSPIRRYADVIVHRLLTAAIEKEKEVEPKEPPANNKELEALAHHINDKNRAAQQAQKQSTELFQCLYFRDKDPLTDERCVADALVRISVQSSRCHADRLWLEVISSRPHQAPPTSGEGVGQGKGAGHGRAELVQEVVRWAEEASQRQAEGQSAAPKLSRWEREFRQSREPNLYTLLQEIRELALADLSSCQNAVPKPEQATCATSA